MGKKVYFVAVQDLDGMVGRYRDEDHGRPKKIPFETEYGDLAAFESALKRGPVLGHQIIYEAIPGSWQRRITRRVEMRLTHSNVGSVVESRIDFIE